MDADDSLFVVAWALVDGENEGNWSWFIRNLSESLGDLDNPTFSIVIDRDKGLQAAIATVIPNAHSFYCCFHIAQNIQTNFGLASKNQFWKLVYAQSKDTFDHQMRKLDEISKDAAEYVDAISHYLWASYAIVGRRYGHVTSNLAEICASMLRDVRELPALGLLKELYNHQAKLFYERYEV